MLREVITALCAVGFYASVFMLRKSLRAARGELKEPSVVQTPRASLAAGIPNALIGAAYYAALTAVVWLAHGHLALALAEAAAVLAAATSVYLGYSLLFVTRRSCTYCWTAHVVNVLLAALVARLLILS